MLLEIKKKRIFPAFVMYKALLYGEEVSFLIMRKTGAITNIVIIRCGHPINASNEFRTAVIDTWKEQYGNAIDLDTFKTQSVISVTFGIRNGGK